MTSTQTNHAALDRPEVSARLFHPRQDPIHSPLGPGQQVTIPVSDDVNIDGRFHWGSPLWPTILFFHGNGEIVSDYDDLGPVYNRLEINFFVVDYRGYGRSTGSPTVSAMLQDCHAIFAFTASWLKLNRYTGPLILMGRSLGSASALELAVGGKVKSDGLIIESGFAYTEPLLRLLGIMPESIGFKEETGFGNLDKIKQVTQPTLIIHAEFDHIIPFSDGQALYDASPTANKRLLKIANANHNDIFYHGQDSYLKAVKLLATQLTETK